MVRRAWRFELQPAVSMDSFGGTFEADLPRVIKHAQGLRQVLEKRSARREFPEFR